MPLGICPFAEQIAGVQTQSRGFTTRVGFVDHIAAGFMTTMRNPSFWNNAGVSAHFCAGRDGSIIQLVNIFDTAFHAGRLGPLSWSRYTQMQTETGTGNPNAWLIGIEHEGFPADIWSEAMYYATYRVKQWCIEEAKTQGHDLLRFGLDSLTGHFMFDGRDRASCPGPNWPRQRLYADLAAEEDEMIRFNAIAAAFQGRALNGDLTMNARADFNLPTAAKRVRIEVYLESGSVQVLDGQTQAYAGQVGWKGQLYGLIEAAIPDGNLVFRGTDARFAQVGIVAYV